MIMIKAYKPIMLLCLFLFLSATPVMANDYIDEAYRLGIVVGCEDGTLQPDRYVTRAEFAVMYARAFKLEEGDNRITFNDVDNHWASKEIKLLASNGLVKGKGGNNFKPDEVMTDVEMLVIYGRIVYKNSIFLDEVETSWKDDPARFSEANPVDRYTVLVAILDVLNNIDEIVE